MSDVKISARQDLLADKLSDPYFDSEKDIRPLFEKQLEACGVEYFDYYLMHALSAKRMEKFKACRAFETAFRLKDEGKAKHIGMSFHDHADVLDGILAEYPQIEFVQLQFNYLDYESPDVQSRLCLETCRRHGKPVFVMEPVRGGKLADLPEKAADILSDIDKSASAASYALRFAAGCEGVAMVLSGMSSLAQVRDNAAVMNDFRPLSERERLALAQVCGILNGENLVPCTACRYCTEQCPKKIPIPEILAVMNAKKAFKDWKTDAPSGDRGSVTARAADCIKCGRCEQACPQHLAIRELLNKAYK